MILHQERITDIRKFVMYSVAVNAARVPTTNFVTDQTDYLRVIKQAIV